MGPGPEAGAPPGRPEYSAGGTGDGLSTSSPSTSSHRGGRASNILQGSSVKNPYIQLGKYSSSTNVCYCLSKCSCSVAAELSSGTTLAGTILNELGGKTTTERYRNKGFERIFEFSRISRENFAQKGDQTNKLETIRTSQGINSQDHHSDINPDVSSHRQTSLKRDKHSRANLDS